MKFCTNEFVGGIAVLGLGLGLGRFFFLRSSETARYRNISVFYFSFSHVSLFAPAPALGSFGSFFQTLLSPAYPAGQRGCRPWEWAGCQRCSTAAEGREGPHSYLNPSSPFSSAHLSKPTISEISRLSLPVFVLSPIRIPSRLVGL